VQPRNVRKTKSTRSDSHWKLDQAACRKAEQQGEDLARLQGFKNAPIDPFLILQAERELVHVEGADFGDAFDGRLSFVGPRFLLCYNTKYDQWPHSGKHHPRVRFTVAHELGHFFLDEHRRALVLRKTSHVSFTEFASGELVERQADSFASGLLLPRYLMAPRVNVEPEPTLDSIRSAAKDFDVSFVGTMVRWVQLSHFPCAVVCVRESRIAWGFVAQSLRDTGFWRARREALVQSTSAVQFLEKVGRSDHHREGQGTGFAAAWLDTEAQALAVTEFYVTIPFNRSVMVFLVADESDLPAETED